VVIDLVCYRKWGHNEGDNPGYTQPLQSKTIEKKPPLSQVYATSLAGESAGDGVAAHVSEAIGEAFQEKLSEALQVADAAATEYRQRMQRAYDDTKALVKSGQARKRGMEGFSGRWKGFTNTYSHAPVETGVSEKVLDRVADAVGTFPEGFTPHPNLKKILEARRDNIRGRKFVDWGTAEAMAFGSLVSEGTAVRLSGQDSRRGTFTQRHAVVVDFENGTEYYPLSHLDPKQAAFDVYDSSLSEAAVMGFEYGYSLDDPASLVMWEAQFGDFANGAQVIIDQFITSGESKWTRSSGLVLLLPHAYEGQGPEHSSARLERFLQMCAEDNIQVIYPTTPAQYFHMLRRQVRRKFRKPLVVMTPKSLLRYTDKKPMEHQAASPVSEFTAGHFREVLDDTNANPDAVTRVLLCSGKVYYDLAARRDELRTQAVAVVRLEQFYPWPGEQLAQVLGRYRRCREWVWVQEESQNMGGWSFVEPRLRAMNFPFEYVGRDASASPATGSHHVHEREQKLLVAGAFATNPSGPIGPGYVGWVESTNGSPAEAKPATAKMKPGEASS
jgi:2-oxoglutarate dehydrogenase E1 component